MSSLLSFLVLQHTLLNQLLEKISKDVDGNTMYELTLVLGNEACDLDSTVSALLWAYYMQSQTENTKSKLYIPVLTIPSNELKLRKETVHLLQQMDKSLIQNLFFIDTISTILSYASTSAINKDSNDKKENEEKKQEISNNGNINAMANFKLNIHLVDHNTLSIALDPILGEYVNYIIDHHKDEGHYLKNCNGNNRNICVVGSNVSNVIQHILSINKHYDLSKLGEQFGALINAAILLDTGGFNEKLKKTTAADIKIYKLFEEYNLNNDYKTWYAQLLNMRIDVTGFGFADLLVKDFKIFQENEINFGIPGLGIRLQSIVESENENMFEILHSFQNEKKLDIITAMTIFSDKLNNNQLQRELALFCDDPVLVEKVSNALETKENQQYLKLQPIQIGKYNHKNQYLLKTSKQPMYYQWWKMDVAISRKKLVPLLRKILSKL